MLVLAVPVAVWWAIGDLSTTPTPYADYVLKAPDVAAWLEATAGVAALAAMLVAVVVLVTTSRSRPLDGWWVVLASLSAAGALAAVGGRVVTAGVVGANIGGGMFILFGGPVVLALVAVAAVRSWLLLKRSRG